MDCSDDQLYTGNDVDIQELVECMNRGTADCIADCQSYRLDFVKLSSGNDDENDDVEEDSEDCVGDCVGDCEDGPQGSGVGDYDDLYDDDKDYIKTPIGMMHRKAAENFYLNGGKTNFGDKARQSRFYYNQFDKSPMEEYRKGNACLVKSCDQAKLIRKGNLVTLPVFVRKNAKRRPKAKGIVVRMSQKHTPLKAVCKEHSNGQSTVWVLSDGEYKRCIL